VPARPRRRSGCLPWVVLAVLVVIAWSAWWAIAADDSIDELDTDEPAPSATATITECSWNPDLSTGTQGTVRVAGTIINSGTTVESFAVDIEYRTGDVVDVGQGFVFDVQPGQTAGWVGGVLDAPAGGTCTVLRVF
jgi:hypothetical protein